MFPYAAGQGVDGTKIFPEEDRSEQTEVSLSLFYRWSFYIPCLVCPDKVNRDNIAYPVCGWDYFRGVNHWFGPTGPFDVRQASVSCLLIEHHSQANHSLRVPHHLSAQPQ